MILLTVCSGLVSAASAICGIGSFWNERRKKAEPVFPLDLLEGTPPMEEAYRRDVEGGAFAQHQFALAEVEKHNRPLKLRARRITILTVGLSVTSATLALYSGFTTFDPYWASLSSGQVSDLASRLRAIEPEPVTIACTGAYCDALALNFKSAFVKAGWPDPAYVTGGGIGVGGIVGIRVDPIDARTEAIAKAIEAAAKIKIIRADDPRQPSYPPGINIVIGTKPVH